MQRMLSGDRAAESAADRAVKAAKETGQTDYSMDLSVREALEAAVVWCRMFGLEFDAVNENVPETLEKYGTESRKISADVYVDDRSCFPWMSEQEWEKYLAE